VASNPVPLRQLLFGCVRCAVLLLVNGLVIRNMLVKQGCTSKQAQGETAGEELRELACISRSCANQFKVRKNPLTGSGFLTVRSDGDDEAYRLMFCNISFRTRKISSCRALNACCIPRPSHICRFDSHNST
jgi:hypothetical protein